MEFIWKLLNNLRKISSQKGCQKTQEQVIIELRQSGYTQKEIAEKLNISVNKVKTILYNLLQQGKIDRKKKYALRNSKKQIISKKSLQDLFKVDYVIDKTVSEKTKAMDKIDWVKKYNVNIESFTKMYATNTCIDTGLYFNIPHRDVSKIAKQLGISKRHFTKAKKVYKK